MYIYKMCTAAYILGYNVADGAVYPYTVHRGKYCFRGIVLPHCQQTQACAGEINSDNGVWYMLLLWPDLVSIFKY